MGRRCGSVACHPLPLSLTVGADVSISDIPQKVGHKACASFACGLKHHLSDMVALKRREACDPRDYAGMEADSAAAAISKDRHRAAGS